MKQGVDIIAPADPGAIVALGCKRYVLSHYLADLLPALVEDGSQVLMRYITKD